MRILKQANKLANLLPEWSWNYTKRKPITSYNPTRAAEPKQETVQPTYTVFNYDATSLEENQLTDEKSCARYKTDPKITWINIDGLNKAEVERLCQTYKVHPLAIEDILSNGQRAKMDDLGDIIYCLLPMLYYNEGTGQIEMEQVSIVLGTNFVLSFQEDPLRDVFDAIREKLRTPQTKIRISAADYLCYSLVDTIVDSYFAIIEKINERIERLEDALLLQKEKSALPKISILRREVMVMRCSIAPVRDLVASFVRSESELLEERHEKYYKDVLDHITQANDYIENHRDMLMNLQDLSMSQINLRMNEVMKIFTMVATLLAPATVIGGIFGMNFEVIPLSAHPLGFYLTVIFMFIVAVIMLIWFKRKGWF